MRQCLRSRLGAQIHVSRTRLLLRVFFESMFSNTDWRRYPLLRVSRQLQYG
jgi:hypothetical protein